MLSANLKQQNGTWVCWSVAQQMNNGPRDARVHVQGANGYTLCSIKTSGDWDYDYHDYPPSEFESCLRCQRVIRTYPPK